MCGRHARVWVAAMTEFSEAERAYLKSQRLGRLATVDPQGQPQANPVGFFPRTTAPS